jgi:hypothetical protein
MRARFSSGNLSAKPKVPETLRNIFFWGDDPLVRERVRLAAEAFSSFRIFFPEDPAGQFHYDIIGVRVIQASAVPEAFSGREPAPLTIAYGPVEYMEKAFLYGCADYLAEPWLPEELFVRCGRLQHLSCINFPGYTVRYTPLTLMSGDKIFPLSTQEFRLLQTLTRHLNTVVPRGELFRILGYSPGKTSARLVDTHISLLRKKLASCRPEPQTQKPSSRDKTTCSTKSWNPIRTVRGIGYGLWNIL